MLGSSRQIERGRALSSGQLRLIQTFLIQFKTLKMLCNNEFMMTSSPTSRCDIAIQ